MAERVVVSGAGSYLAGRLALQLLDQGQRVRAVLAPGESARTLFAGRGGELELAVAEPSLVGGLFAAYRGAELAVHFPFGAGPLDPLALRSAALSIDAALEAARKAGVGRLVVSTSVLASVGGAWVQPAPRQWADALGALRAASGRVLEAARSGRGVALVEPAVPVGGGDIERTALGRSLLAYLRWPRSLPVPVSSGTLCYADAEALALGHVLVLRAGRAKAGPSVEPFVLGGEQLTHRALLELLYATTGLGRAATRDSSALGARLVTGPVGWLRGLPSLVPGALLGLGAGVDCAGGARGPAEALGYRSTAVRPAFVAALASLVARNLLPPDIARGLKLEPGPEAERLRGDRAQSEDGAAPQSG
jgi:nucleoside-diphosphate-sugar epimerase